MRYFIATYYSKPTGKVNESVKVDSKVRMKDLQGASVIIDYKERKIVKSNFEEELGADMKHDFDTINNFYKEHHPQIISQLEAKYQILAEVSEMVKGMVEDAKAEQPAEEQPEVIANETGKDITNKLKKIADDVS